MKPLSRLFVVLAFGASSALAGCAYHAPAPQHERTMQGPGHDAPPPRPRSFSDPGPNYPDTGR